MKKHPYFLTFFLIPILLFCSCGQKSDSPVLVVEPIIEDSTEEPDETVSEQSPELPPEPGMVRSRITNEWVSEEQNNTRPVAIMIPNSSTASHYGLSKASILYECNVEGSMTRLMGIFDDWKTPEKLGNIRSCRDYYVYWAFEWDAIYIHYGGPFYIDEVIGRDDTQNIDCLTYNDGSFRDNSAKNSTDNAFTDQSRIEKALDHFGYSSEYREGYADEQHFLFSSDAEPNLLTQYSDSIEASKIDMSQCYPVTNCYFVYNEETGLYDRFQRLSGSSDGPHIDIENDEQLAFKNIIVQNTYHEIRDQKGYLAFQVHDTERDGWFFTNGRGIHINWKKISDYGATRYYDDDGNEIFFNTGKTMVLIVEDGDTFAVNDKTLVY